MKSIIAMVACVIVALGCSQASNLLGGGPNLEGRWTFVNGSWGKSEVEILSNGKCWYTGMFIEKSEATCEQSGNTLKIYIEGKLTETLEYDQDYNVLRDPDNEIRVFEKR
jgi:hypothetical protein